MSQINLQKQERPSMPAKTTQAQPLEKPTRTQPKTSTILRKCA
jgi:hypothetical protein